MKNGRLHPVVRWSPHPKEKKQEIKFLLLETHLFLATVLHHQLLIN
jgi:hypothetical protein